MEIPVLKTPLYEKHLERGGKMVDFAGWKLPVQYGGVLEEHKAVRTSAGLFDTSHMGEIAVSGYDSFDFLQYILTNDIERLSDKSSLYSHICNEKGGILDDVFVFRFRDHLFWLVVNASNTEKIFQWLVKNRGAYKVEIENLSDKYGKLDLQGPVSEAIISGILNAREKLPERFNFIETMIGNRPVIISRTGYTGEDGFEIYSEWADAVNIWDIILEQGQDKGLVPAGLGARDSLRLEACYSLYGNELDEMVTPVEAGIGWAVREKMSSFIGKEVLLKQKREGTVRKIAAFEMEGKAIARHGYSVLFGGRLTGTVTSGGFSPTFRKSIGLAMIDSPLADPGIRIEVEIRNRLETAVIVKKPFYKFAGGKYV